ncbi:MAG: hypothetical protein ACRCYU_09540 [Nocardioides sp.]
MKNKLVWLVVLMGLGFWLAVDQDSMLDTIRGAFEFVGDFLRRIYRAFIDGANS